MTLPRAQAAAAAPSVVTGPLAELVKYFLASAIALGADAGLLALATRAGLAYPVAAAVGFLAGLGVAYWLSIRWVFEARSMNNGVAEFAAFASIGIAGLGLTELVLWATIEHMAWSLPPAKIAAAGGVFLFNFGVRKALLFRPSAR